MRFLVLPFAIKSDDVLYFFFFSGITFMLATVIQELETQTLNPTLRPEEAVQFQNWYMSKIIDPLPLLESIKNCECPRIYIPVCGTDNKTYTNLCWMNCMNEKRGTDVEIFYAGHCFQFIDPFDY